MELGATSRVPLTKILEFRILEPIKTDKYQKIRLPSSYFLLEKLQTIIMVLINFGSFFIFSKLSDLLVVVLRGCSNVLQMDMIFQESNSSRWIPPVIHNL